MRRFIFEIFCLFFDFRKNSRKILSDTGKNGRHPDGGAPGKMEGIQFPGRTGKNEGYPVPRVSTPPGKMEGIQFQSRHREKWKASGSQAPPGKMNVIQFLTTTGKNKSRPVQKVVDSAKT